MRVTPEANELRKPPPAPCTFALTHNGEGALPVWTKSVNSKVARGGIGVAATVTKNVGAYCSLERGQ